jgi:hypothetical protein
MGVMFGYCVTCMDGGHVWLLCDLYGWGSCVACMDVGHVWLLCE